MKLRAIKLNKWVCLMLFFVLPFAAGKFAIYCGLYNFGFVSGWELFYDNSWGAAYGYSFAIIAYWVFSPFVIIWIRCQAEFQEISLARAWVIIMGGGLILFIMLIIAVKGPPVSSIENPTKGIRMIMMLGKTYPGFCMMYSGIVFSCIAIGYFTSTIFLRIIK